MLQLAYSCIHGGSLSDDLPSFHREAMVHSAPEQIRDSSGMGRQLLLHLTALLRVRLLHTPAPSRGKRLAATPTQSLVSALRPGRLQSLPLRLPSVGLVRPRHRTPFSLHRRSKHLPRARDQPLHQAHAL